MFNHTKTQWHLNPINSYFKQNTRKSDKVEDSSTQNQSV